MGPCVPVLLYLISFLSLSSNLLNLQNSTELTKKPSNGPVLHSYFLFIYVENVAIDEMTFQIHKFQKETKTGYILKYYIQSKRLL